MGSGSRLVPGEGTDHDHGHFYCLALFRLGNRKWEAESHLGGATRDEGGRGDFPLPGAAPQTTVRGTPTTHALIPPAEGPLIPVGVRHLCRKTGHCSATGEELGGVERG